MALSYTKLFNSITDSSVWSESKDVKILWVTMMAMCDKNGEIRAALPGLARRAVLTIKETELALTVLKAPDPHSTNPENEGRRIGEIDGGWCLLNHRYYRNLLSDADKREKDAIRQARHRDKKKCDMSRIDRDACDKSRESRHTDTDTDTDTDTTATDHCSKSGASSKVSSVSKINCENFQKTENLSPVLFDNSASEVPKVPKVKTMKAKKEPLKQLNGYNPIAIWIDAGKKGMGIGTFTVLKQEIKFLTELGNQYTRGEFCAMLNAYSRHCLEKGVAWRFYQDFYLNRHQWRKLGGPGTPPEKDPDDIDENNLPDPRNNPE